MLSVFSIHCERESKSEVEPRIVLYAKWRTREIDDRLFHRILGDCKPFLNELTRPDFRGQVNITNSFDR